MNRNDFPAIGLMGVLSLSACGGGDSSGSPLPTDPAPTVTIAVSPSSVRAYQTATLTWSSTNASTCSASGGEWAGPQPISGSLPISLSGPGTYTYKLSCSSSAAATASGSATLTVTPAQLAILTGALSNGVIGTSFDQMIQATGGVAPFTWKVSSGALPHNLSLLPSTTNTVMISGTPDTAAQGVVFTIEVADSAHATASQPYTVSILLQADNLVLSPVVGLDFGNQIVGRVSGALTETLTNTATSDMVIDSIAIAPVGANAGEFKQTGTTCGTRLAGGASCEVNVSFTPGQTGPRIAALTINDDTAGSPQAVGLAGLGLSVGPNATPSASGLVFRTELVGTTSPAQVLALTNYGAAALNIGSISVRTPFAETNNCVPSLAPQATCTISVTFTPGGPGTMTGTLSISDDAAGSPQKVSLSGTGATMTPLLNGRCYSICKPDATVSQCAAGQPAKTPGFSGCSYGQLGHGPTVPVDLGTACAVPPGGWHDRGYCETE